MTFPRIKPRQTKLGEPCIVEVRIALEPELTVEHFEGLEACYTPLKVTDDDVEQQIAGMKRQRGIENDDAKLLAALPFKTLEEFAVEVRKSLETVAREKTAENKKDAVINKLIDANSCPLREELVEQQIMVQLHQFSRQIGKQNMENYIKSTGRSIDEVKQEIRPEAEAMLKKNLLLAAVADKIDFTITKRTSKTRFCGRKVRSWI